MFVWLPLVLILVLTHTGFKILTRVIFFPIVYCFLVKISEQNVLPKLSLEKSRIYISWCAFLFLSLLLMMLCSFLHCSRIQLNEKGVITPPQSCLRISGHLIKPWTNNQKGHLWSGLYVWGPKQPKQVATYAGQLTSRTGLSLANRFPLLGRVHWIIPTAKSCLVMV